MSLLLAAYMWSEDENLVKMFILNTPTKVYFGNMFSYQQLWIDIMMKFDYTKLVLRYFFWATEISQKENEFNGLNLKSNANSNRFLHKSLGLIVQN